MVDTEVKTTIETILSAFEVVEKHNKLIKELRADVERLLKENYYFSQEIIKLKEIGE